VKIGPVDTGIALLIVIIKKKKLTQAKYRPIALPASLPSGLNNNKINDKNLCNKRH